MGIDWALTLSKLKRFTQDVDTFEERRRRRRRARHLSTSLEARFLHLSNFPITADTQREICQSPPDLLFLRCFKLHEKLASCLNVLIRLPADRHHRRGKWRDRFSSSSHIQLARFSPIPIPMPTSPSLFMNPRARACLPASPLFVYHPFRTNDYLHAASLSTLPPHAAVEYYALSWKW